MVDVPLVRCVSQWFRERSEHQDDILRRTQNYSLGLTPKQKAAKDLTTPSIR